MKNAIRVSVVLLALLVVILLLRALGLESRQVVAVASEPVVVDDLEVAERLAVGLRQRTIAHSLDAPVEAEAFRELHERLRGLYPLAHARLEREVVSEYSLLYTWKGKRPDLPVVLLLAHQDVVPVEAGSDEAWVHPPFAGVIADGYVWGRGAMDDKNNLFCSLEAVERLLARGFEPERSILLAFGHDEELGGPKGAQAIAALLAARGTRAMLVLDEGGAISQGDIAIIPDPVAVVGIAEKGSVSLDLTVETLGGHSSVPPRHTGIGVLSAAIVKLEAKPFPASLTGATRSLFEFIGPELSFPLRTVMANLWLFGPVLERVFANSPTLDAMQRTTTAVTLVKGGVKSNVLPSRAKATVNFRILPGDSIDDVVAHASRVIADDRVTITPRPEAREPSPISPVDTEGFRALQAAISSEFPTAVVAPYLVMGGTDSRYYGEVSDNLYRFAPFEFDADDRQRIHGTNERVAVEALGPAVRFYLRLLELSASS